MEANKPWLDFIGGGTADFQGEPILRDEFGEPLISSDWENEVYKNINFRPSKIATQQYINNLPHFLTRAEEYIKRYVEDFHANMVRFSIDFARLCPAPGEFNEQIMEQYIKVFYFIKKYGAEPMVTLFHWPTPKFLCSYDAEGNIKTGAWENPKVLECFKFYIKNVVGYLSNKDKIRNALKHQNLPEDEDFISGEIVRYFISINEPSMVAFDGYIAGTFPPYRKINFPLFGKVLKTLKKAHIIACDEVRKLPWTVKIGASNNWTYFDGIFGNILQKFFNEKLMRNFIGDEKPDFIALQYYCRATVPSFYPPIGKVRPKNRHYCDHPGWGDIYPEAMYIFLKRIQVLYPDTDIFITESGFADHADTKRPHWISETFKNVLKAKNEGVRVRGFLIWTPISNFEWEQGMDVDFGLTSESDLGKPLIPKPDKVAGWEMWEVISKTTKNPVVENIGSLDSLQKRAKWQFEKATKK